jgi:plastocyanin
MRKQLLRPMYLGGLILVAVTSGHVKPALAADAVITIQIIKNAQHQFVFDQPNVTIAAGQSIKWVATTGTHDLAPDSASDPLVDTGPFNSSNPPTQTFKSSGVIHYHCSFHPATMKGTITVK